MVPLLDEPKRSPDSTVKEKTSLNQVMNNVFYLGMLNIVVGQRANKMVISVIIFVFCNNY